MKQMNFRWLPLFGLLVCGSVQADITSNWDKFLKFPDGDNFLTLSNSVAAMPDRCNRSVAPDQSQRTLLFGLIRKGNQLAFHAALIVSKCFDGGEAEDFDRSAGLFFETKPLNFLQLAQENKVSDPELKRMLIMLPLETVDDIDAKIVVLKKRIRILSAVNDYEVENVKKTGLAFLASEDRELEKIKIEINDNGHAH
jgi:hypothetical protein